MANETFYVAEQELSFADSLLNSNYCWFCQLSFGKLEKVFGHFSN